MDEGKARINPTILSFSSKMPNLTRLARKFHL